MSGVSSSPITPTTESKLKNNHSAQGCPGMEKAWSISSLILVFSVLTVGVSATIIGVTNFFLYRDSVSDVAVIARRLLINRISNGTLEFLATGPRLLNVTMDSFHIYEHTSNMMNADKHVPLMIMKLAFDSSPKVLSVKFGWENGTVLGIQPTRRRMFETNGNGTLNYREFDLKTMKTGRVIGECGNYDVKKKKWYAAPLTLNRTLWTNFYKIFETESKFVVTIATPYYSVVTGRFVGVLALECDLDHLSSFLATNPNYKATRIFVVDSNDTLVATSTLGSYPVNSSQTVDSEVLETIKQMHKKNISFQTAGSLREFSYGPNGKKRIVAALAIKGDYGIEWLIVANVFSILHAAYKAQTVSAYICATSVVLAVLLAVTISLCVALPLRRVRVEMDKVANMHFEKQKKIYSFHLYELNEMVRSLYKMKKGLRSFEKFVPSTVVKTIVRSGRKTCLGVVERELSVLFCDIKDFTTMTESIDPNSLVFLLSGFFSEMSDIIVQNQGVVDKFIGDAIMALFNAPDLIENHAVSAVTAAYEMKTRLMETNQSWMKQKLPPLEIRAGVNTATCLVGNVGGELRMNYTALGDGVNVASRCEWLNKRYGTDIMITGDTYEAVKHLFICRWLTVVYLKGKTLPVHVYEVICPAGRETKEEIELCSLHLDIRIAIEKRQGDRAIQICSELTYKNPDNIAARELLDRLHNCKGDYSLGAIALHLSGISVPTTRKELH